MKSCYLDNAVLPKIVSQNQNDFLVTFSLTSEPRSATCDGHCPRIGLRCTGNDTSTCSWIDGSPLTGYNNLEPSRAYNNSLAEKWCSDLFDHSRYNSSFYLSVFEKGIWERIDYSEYASFLCQKGRSEVYLVLFLYRCKSHFCGRED